MEYLRAETCSLIGNVSATMLAAFFPGKKKTTQKRFNQNKLCSLCRAVRVDRMVIELRPNEHIAPGPPQEEGTVCLLNDLPVCGMNRGKQHENHINLCSYKPESLV